MHIIINNSSMVPIYEQIIDQIKTAIIKGELQPDTVLPSVRGLSKELKISALTVKKAYDNLEEEGSDRNILVFFINIVQPLNTDRRKNDRR